MEFKLAEDNTTEIEEEDTRKEEKKLRREEKREEKKEQKRRERVKYITIDSHGFDVVTTKRGLFSMQKRRSIPKMIRNVVISLIFTVVFGIFSVFATFDYVRSRNWPCKTAMVYDVEAFTTGESHGSGNEETVFYRYKYIFSVDGVDYEGEIPKDKEKPSSTISIYYNPKNPAEKKLQEPIMYPIIGYIGFAIFFVWYIVSSKIKKHYLNDVYEFRT